MRHVSAHKHIEAEVQQAWNESRAVALNEAFAFIVEHRDSVLTWPEIERAFVERFFDTVEDGERE